MPIANVFVSKDLQLEVEDLADFTSSWSTQSKVPGNHMTVNFLPSLCQSGVVYDLMAVLYLPSLWSEEKVQALQIGLSNALSKSFDVQVDRLLVMTTVLQSGRVVANGKTEN